MEHHTIFISDLHLSDATTKTNILFLKFAAEIMPTTDALYILGDLFQFWAGDDHLLPSHIQIKTTLKEISEKIPVYLMPGNRDFLLGQIFAKESGCTLISDPTVIDLYGKPTLLTHGDMLCTKDSKYRLFRALVQLPFAIKIFLLLPLKLRLWIATNVQKYSAKMKLKKKKNTLAPQLATVKKLLIKFAAKQIIHGHTHIVEIEEFAIDSNKPTTQQTRRISLGEWDNEGNMLIYSNNHTFAFKNLK